MNKWLIVVIMGVLPMLGQSQMGLNIKYLLGQSEVLDEVNISQNGMIASLEYGFRLKQKRIEFHPAIGYRFSFNTTDYDGYFWSVDIDLTTAIYPFDFGGDCDCPTFSKDGNIVKKGLFIEISPGMTNQYFTRYIIRDDPPGMEQTKSSSNLQWKLGFGIGLDIGISESFTLSPIVSYTRLQSATWDALNEDASAGYLDDQSYIGLGLRTVYKPNPKRLRRR